MAEVLRVEEIIEADDNLKEKDILEGDTDSSAQTMEEEK
jgi:hypothetical protein